jgi:hypothetical protein
VHCELALPATDSLVAEHGLLLAVVTAVHDKCQLMAVGFFLSTGDELAASQSDEPCVDLHVLLVRKL